MSSAGFLLPTPLHSAMKPEIFARPLCLKEHSFKTALTNRRPVLGSADAS